MRTYSFLMLVFIAFQAQGQSTQTQNAVSRVDAFSQKVKEWLKPALTIKTNSRHYKNAISINAPFFSTYGVNYSRKIAPALAVEVGFKRHNYDKDRSNFIFKMIRYKKSTIGNQYHLGLRQYFLGEVYDGFYAEYGLSYAQLSIINKQYVDTEKTNAPEDFFRTFDHSAKLNLYTGKLGMGYSVTRNHFYFDIAGGAFSKRVQYISRSKNYNYRIWPVYCKVAVGYAF